MELYLNCGSDYSIQDDKGNKHTPEEAKVLVEAGKVDDCNLAFQRLVNNDYDIEAVKKFFRENP